MKLLMPAVWTSLPSYVRDEIATTVEKKSEDLVAKMMLEVRSNVLDIIDLKGYAERRADQNKEVMVDIFLKIGKSEIKFIERSGFYFGFLFGAVQVCFENQCAIQHRQFVSHI